MTHTGLTAAFHYLFLLPVVFALAFMIWVFCNLTVQSKRKRRSQPIPLDNDGRR